MYARFNIIDESENIGGVAVQSNYYVPNVWLSIIAMSAWIDVGMHPIFHGVVARIMLAMEDVFTEEDRKGPFENLVYTFTFWISRA